MKYRIVSEAELINRQSWADFVASHPNGNIFQTPEFMSFIGELRNYTPALVCCCNIDGEIIGVLTGVIQEEKSLLKKIFSRRLIVWGGPLVKDNNSEVTDLLIKDLVKNYSSKCIYFEFRNMFNLEWARSAFLARGFSYTEHLNYIVDIDLRELVVKRLSSGKARQIKKSTKNGARVLDEVSLEQVRSFYNILCHLYRTKVKKPIPEWEFFERFYHHPELGRYLLVESNNKIVGGIMCPVFKNRSIYEWYICGEDGIHEGIYPSVLATWAPIDFALTHGVGQFDFMGAGKPDADYGVREFKAGFGGSLVSYGRFTRINNPLLYQFGKLGLKLLSRFSK